MNTLDPRSALVLDTLELGRRAGAMVKRSFTAAAPPDLGTEVIGVPTGSELAVELRLESVIEGVLVSGRVRAGVVGQCARCLTDLTDEVDVDFQELYEYPDEANSADDEEALRLDGDLLDLEPVVRDAIVLALPLAPLCSPDCLGLCTQCGADLNETPDHHHDSVDARWQKLSELLPESKEG